MKIKIVILSFLFIAITYQLLAQSANQLPIYMDSSKEIEERVEDLLSRMTLEEKVDMLGGIDMFKTIGNKRLGIPR